MHNPRQEILEKKGVSIDVLFFRCGASIAEVTPNAARSTLHLIHRTYDPDLETIVDLALLSLEGLLRRV